MSIFPYLVGSFATILVAIIYRYFSKKTKKNQLKITQTSIYDMLKPFILLHKEEKVIRTQTTEFEKKQYVPVILVDHQAYWISNNTLFVADEIDGSIDKESARPVDTMAMDRVQLDKTIFIVDALTEGAENDHRNSGNQIF